MVQWSGNSMGSHKHGISGVSGPSPKTKFMVTFDRNREDAWVRKMKHRRLQNPVSSVLDLFARLRKR